MGPASNSKPPRGGVVAYDIVNLSEKRVMSPANPDDPCLCSVCNCGVHRCPGISCRPRLQSSTQYKDDYPERDLHLVDAPGQAAKGKWRTLALKGATPTIADDGHFVTTTAAFFGATAGSAKPAGSVPRISHSAPDSAITALRGEDSDPFAVNWRARSYKPTDRYVPSAAFVAQTTAKELLSAHAVVERPTRHGAKLRVAVRQGLLSEQDGIGSSPALPTQSVMHEQQQAVQRAVEPGFARPPPALPRPQLSLPGKRGGDESSRPPSTIELLPPRPLTSYQSDYNRRVVPSTPAAVIRHLRKAQKERGTAPVADDRDFITSNGAAFCDTAVQRTPPRRTGTYGTRRVDCPAARLYSLAQPATIEADGHAHLRRLAMAFGSSAPSPPTATQRP